MFTQALNDQLVRAGFRARDKAALIAQRRLVITKTPHAMGTRMVAILDGVEVLNKTVIDIRSISYTLTDD